MVAPGIMEPSAPRSLERMDSFSLACLKASVLRAALLMSNMSNLSDDSSDEDHLICMRNAFNNRK